MSKSGKNEAIRSIGALAVAAANLEKHARTIHDEAVHARGIW